MAVVAQVKSGVQLECISKCWLFIQLPLYHKAPWGSSTGYFRMLLDRGLPAEEWVSSDLCYLRLVAQGSHPFAHKFSPCFALKMTKPFSR